MRLNYHEAVVQEQNRQKQLKIKSVIIFNFIKTNRKKQNPHIAFFQAYEGLQNDKWNKI